MTRAIIIISAASAFAAIGAASAPARACNHGSHPSITGDKRLPASPHVAAIAEAPKREAADKLFYLRLGGAGMPASGLHGGPELGLGLRLELDRIGLDASMGLGVTQTGPTMEITGIRGSWMKLGAQYYLTPDEDTSPYFGAGLSWGGRRQRICEERYSGSGLQADLVAGYELLRSSTIRLFVQADATLPLYRVTQRQNAPNLLVKVGGDPPAQRYLPTVGLSLGIAWGRAHVIGVQELE